MKRPTHIFVRLQYPNDPTPVLSVVSFVEHPTLFKWISKYGTDLITLPNVPYESLSDALPPFWGEMRRYAFCCIAEFFKAVWNPPMPDAAESEAIPAESEAIPAESEATPAESEAIPAESEATPAESEAIPTDPEPDPFCLEDMLRGQTVTFHSSIIDVEWVDPDELADNDDACVTGLHMDFRELLAMIRVLKPDEKDKHAYFDQKIKYHMAWRRRMPSKLVCHFDNARDNEDDEIDSSYLDIE